MMENNVSIGEQKEKCAKARNVCGIKSVLMGLDEKVQRVVSRQMREVSETTKNKSCNFSFDIQFFKKSMCRCFSFHLRRRNFPSMRLSQRRCGFLKCTRRRSSSSDFVGANVCAREELLFGMCLSY